MKKIILFIVVIVSMLSLCACSKKCESCGKATDNMYDFFGKEVCEDCFFF